MVCIEMSKLINQLNIYVNLPKTKNKKILILDPMLATGNSSSAAIDLIKDKGVKIKDIKLVSLLACS